MNLRRFLAVSTLLVALLAANSACGGDDVETVETSFDQHVLPFLDQYCMRCHNADEMNSGVRVDQLNAALEDRYLRLWEVVQSQVGDEVMPPDDEPQPTHDQRQRFLESIDQALDFARSRPTPKNGSVRRMTVSQYRNTLRELLLIEDDLADILPPDAVSQDGFINNEETLVLSPLLLETYFEIAEEALQRCIVDPATKPSIQNFRVDLGASLNPTPCPDQLILGANSLLLKNEDFMVTQLTPDKPFSFDPIAMRTTYRFIEGYQGNDTVRGWREYDSIYHAVFACMRGTDGYPKGQAYSTVPEGLLLRPAIPSAEVFGVDSTYGPRANFKISLRELPDDGHFRVTVTAAKYDDGLLLDPGAPAQAPEAEAALVYQNGDDPQAVMIPRAGIYQVDVYAASKEEVILHLGDRQFSGTLQQPAFLAVRLAAGPLRVHVSPTGSTGVERIVFTPLDSQHEVARRLIALEKRSPRVGVHLGLRRDCGSTLAQVGSPRTVSSHTPERFVFEGAIRNFPSPEVEKNNVNYLAGIREIGVHSEYTDGRDMPRMLIRSVEFEGPFYEQWPPLSHRNIFIDSDHKNDPPAYAREIIRAFATRAYRRPINDAEASAPMRVFQESFAAGGDFQESVKEALLVVLTSPQFLYLIESSSGPAPEPLDEYELASKLSYFLWNGPPDDALLDSAANGTLREQLNSQLGRMIEHPHFSRFVDEFAFRWLSLDKFDVLEPDRERFPKLTPDARTELRREPAEFLSYLIRNNLPVRNLIESDFVVANEVVASYYDLAERPESGFEFVAIPHGRRELGGVLTQAAIMAGLSNGRESNPVKRGAWLARKIVAEPPDDPPPNVPALEEDVSQLSLRQRLERHRDQPGCAQCHAKIDPWGVPFEEFDAAGRLKPQATDARSTLPDQTEVSGVQELRAYLAEDRLDQVAFGFLKHLATYAAARNLSYNELEYLKREVVKLKADGYRMRDLIHFVVDSPMFLEK